MVRLVSGELSASKSLRDKPIKFSKRVANYDLYLVIICKRLLSMFFLIPNPLRLPPQDSPSSTPVLLRVDPDGFFLYWTADGQVSPICVCEPFP